MAHVDLGSRLLAFFLLIVNSKRRILTGHLPVPGCPAGQPLQEAHSSFVMLSLFIDRDKEESCTKDVPTVAMALPKPPFCPLLISPNHLAFQALQPNTVMSGLRSLH